MIGRISNASRKKRAREASDAGEFGGFEIPATVSRFEVAAEASGAPAACGAFAAPPQVGTGGAEEGVYWVYASFAEGVRAVRATGEDVGADLEADGSPVLVPAGTRARLHYPMHTHGSTRYMKYARVDEDTGQFALYHIPVYAEAEGGVVFRYVDKFES